MSTSVVLQPGYLPWLGFFDQLRRADVFVYYDDVQYDKHGWRNRNRIKTQTGAALAYRSRFVTAASDLPRILDLEIDARAPWARKHVASIRQAYARAPYLGCYMPALEELLHRKWERLVDLDIAAADLMAALVRVDAARRAVVGARHRRWANAAARGHLPPFRCDDVSQRRCGAGLPRRRVVRAAWHRGRMAALPAPGLSSAPRRVRAVHVGARPVAQLRRRSAVRARGGVSCASTHEAERTARA